MILKYDVKRLTVNMNGGSAEWALLPNPVTDF